MNEVIILFGEMGSGKNYWGEKIAKEKDYQFFDGDDVILPEMLEYVSRFKFITRSMLTAYVEHLAKETAEKAKTDNVVLAQALYFNEDRLYLAKYLEEQGYAVRFIWVRVPFWRNIRQIFSRILGTLWVLYWLVNHFWFEKPTHKYEMVQ